MKRVELLDDYTSGIMSDELAAGFEEDLFAAAAKGDDVDDRWYDRFHRLVQYIAASGVLVRGSTAQDIEDLRRGGTRVHVVDLGSGGKAEWDNPKTEVDFVVTCARVDIRGWEKVNADVETPDGTHLHTFRDVLPDPTSGHVYAICAAPLAKMGFGGDRRITRITGVRPGKSEREEIALYDTTPV